MIQFAELMVLIITVEQNYIVTTVVDMVSIECSVQLKIPQIWARSSSLDW